MCSDVLLDDEVIMVVTEMGERARLHDSEDSLTTLDYVVPSSQRSLAYHNGRNIITC